VSDEALIGTRSRRQLDQRLELAIGLTAVGLLLVGCFLVLRPFLSALLWGAVLAYTTWPLYQRVLAAVGGRRTAAASLMTIGLAIAFVLPLVLVGSSAVDGVRRLIAIVEEVFGRGLPPLPAWVATLPFVGGWIAELWEGLTAGTSGAIDLLRPYLTTLQDAAVGLAVSLGGGLIEITLSVLITFFLYRDGDAVVLQAKAVGGRIVGDRAQHLFEVAGGTVKGVVYGIVGTALIQGALSAIGFWVAGVPSAFVLGFICFFLALIPMIGPPVVWGPVTIWLFTQGEIAWGIFMLVWGAVVVSSSDNFIRAWLISRTSKLTFLVVFLGVVGGAIAFGFLGIFLGPVLLAVGFAVLKDWTAARPRIVPAA
jgi:predicted PurR-regulated permease PerM